MNILETERLILRYFTLKDLDELYNLVYADSQVKDSWSAAKGTPAEIKERFATQRILPQGNLGFRAIILGSG